MSTYNENIAMEDVDHQFHSSLEIKREQAIWVRHAYKQYGTKKNPFVVLDDLNMTVPKGSIYGLLGASGCGKTTLLGCIIGRKKLNSGEIWVLGGRPGSPGSGVPGARVGYMPQELALYGEFTIRETLHYFGGLVGMRNREIEERLSFLLSLLMLPPADKPVGDLSGGQQRRVSLASALIHEPELLILDEPTVGVDPVLRQIIWDHLVNITQTGSTTVIITTHYIDETRQAHLVSLFFLSYLFHEII
ncbi:ABC transporter G family member 23-like [Photinus pyralis]|uniref:ABC transporter G family member 23-like n=1 Tax=Photinus pyralis TaxID=7054 RepID=UPI0012676C2B|nr:ABC transporter G family member 23-like [Photinus pyralis]